MENLKNTTTQFVSINASYDKVFDYLKNPLLYKDWSINFIKDVIVENNETFAITPMGKTKFWVKGDKSTGNIDIFMGAGRHPTPTRLLPNGDGVTYLFTLFQPDGMPDIIWNEQGIPSLVEELETLKNIMEK